MPKDVAAHHDLTSLKPLDSIRAAFATLFSTGDRLIMVSGTPPAGSDRFEIVVHEARPARARCSPIRATSCSCRSPSR